MSKVDRSQPLITAEELRALVHYDPETGEMTWRVARSNNTWAGKPVGTVDANGYARVEILTRRYLVHRLAWLYVHGRWPNSVIDHINGVGTDNRLANLREATVSQNAINATYRRKGKTLPQGVGLDRRTGRYTARLYHNRISYFLGTFETVDEARAAYLALAKEKFGEFVREAA